MKPTLTDLAKKYYCDKYYRHSYMPLYEELLGGKDVGRLIELGIGYEDLMKPFVPKFVPQCSMRMWHDYWPDAAIFACDVREDVLWNDDKEHVWSTVCDQSSVAGLRQLIEWSGGDFDVIVDDGSHQYEHQLLTATILMPTLNRNGLYIIEDVWPDTGVKLAQALKGRYYGFDKCPDDGVVVVQI